jgi:hypothetical protein
MEAHVGIAVGENGHVRAVPRPVLIASGTDLVPQENTGS